MKIRAINMLVALNYLLATTALSAQPMLNYNINQYDEYQPAEAHSWNEDRSFEPMAWNESTPMKIDLEFQPVSHVCYSNLLSFQIANGNIVLYPNTSQNTIIYGRTRVSKDEIKQSNAFTLIVGSPVCRFKISTQIYEFLNDRWQTKNTQRQNVNESSIAEIWKKIRDENLSDTEKSNLTAERKRLEAEMNKRFEDNKDRLKNALASKGYEDSQILSILTKNKSQRSRNISYFSSTFTASRECFFGSGHIDFSGANPSLIYVANPPTERTDDSWFEVRVGHSASENKHEILFSNRKCAVKIVLTEEVKLAGYWINVPVLEH